MCVRKVREMRVYSTRAAMRKAFAAEMSPAVGLTIKVYDDPANACAGADIVLAATNAIMPVMKPEWIEKGMHISTIKPGEFSPAVVAKADGKATPIEDCDPVFITSRGLHVPEEPGGELQNLAEEVGWKRLVTLTQPRNPDGAKGRLRRGAARPSIDPIRAFPLVSAPRLGSQVNGYFRVILY